MDVLPIKAYRKEILYALEHHQVLILTAETGSGKTTQIPQFLIQAGYTLANRQVAVVLPRKIAAISLAKRVADELGCHNGEVAHRVRFNSNSNEHSRLLFLTDGTLVQQLYDDPLLSRYSVVVLDDVHERSISYDILFAFLKRILTLRTDLKIVITSATLENESLRKFFEREANCKSDAPALKVATLNIIGRLFPVRIHYLLENSKNYFLKVFQTVVYIDRERQDGDVLVFLPSLQEIQAMKHMLDGYALENKRSLTVLPLHSRLLIQEQTAVFEHIHDRKVILATNIAESSITIPDVSYVVDCGYVKIKVFDGESQVDKMLVVACGQSSAAQRAGRAGRIEQGECFRIYTEEAFLSMQSSIPAEIHRVDLTNFLLKLKGLGVQNILSFRMVEMPEERSVARAIDTLCAYGLVTEQFQLTSNGEKVGQLPVDIRNGCMLINSFDPRFGCSQEILMLVSMLEVQRQLFTTKGVGLLKIKKKIGAKEGDFLTLINLFIRCQHAKPAEGRRICGEYKLRYQSVEQALRIHDQLKSCLKRFNRFKSEGERMEQMCGAGEEKIHFQIRSSKDQHESILRCILTGYFTNVAQLQGDGSYLNLRSKERLQIHSTSILSVVYPEWIVYLQIVRTHGYFIHNGSAIYPEWLFELAGHYYVDARENLARQNYVKSKEVEREEHQPKNSSLKGLVQVGGFKPKHQVFNTSVLGLKKMKTTQLSFEEEL